MTMKENRRQGSVNKGHNKYLRNVTCSTCKPPEQPRDVACRLISTWRTREEHLWLSLKRLKRKNLLWLSTLAAVIAEGSDLK